MRRARALAAAVLALGAASQPAAAGSRAEIDIVDGEPPRPLASATVSGFNASGGPATVALRADDRPGAPYRDRVGVERILPPGPFSFSVRLGTLVSPGGRSLDFGRTARVAAFSDTPGVSVSNVALADAPFLPEGARGWFFGPAAAAPLDGFDVVEPTDPRVSGTSGPGRAVRLGFGGSDPVLAWGTFLTRFATPLPNGRWRLSLWTEDPGAWETLPPVLERRIVVNGQRVLYERRSYRDWVRDRYMAGRDAEADPSAPPFAALGARRGGRVDADVEVTDGKLEIDLAGTPAAAIDLAAVVAVPADGRVSSWSAMENVRAEAFASAWPVVGRVPEDPRARTPQIRSDGRATADAAPGGLAILRFVASSPVKTAAPAGIRWDGDTLGAKLFWGQWRWRRPNAAASALLASADLLRGDADRMGIEPSLPRPLVLVVRVPPGARPGTRTGSVVLHLPGRDVSAPFAVEVLPVSRPEPRQLTGVFLDFAPHLWGDPSTREDARRQAVCDMDDLKWFGLAVPAPPLEDPDDPEARARFVGELRDAEMRFGPRIVAYAPLRHVALSIGRERAAADVAAADAAVAAAGLQRPFWTFADEATSSGTAEAAAALAAAVRAADPAARLALNVNAASDTALLPGASLVMTNPGFGAGIADVAALRARGVTPWLYNMPSLRSGGGLQLWASGADAMVQWHARMPSADAFDPTDGREGDVQFLWPTPGVCGPPDIDASLLDLAEGAEDLRWMAWLERRASDGDGRASALLARVRRTVQASPAGLDDEALASVRRAVVSLSKEKSGK